MQASASQSSPPKQGDIRQLTSTVATRDNSPQVGGEVAWRTSACSCPRRDTAKGPTHFKSRCSPICRALFETVTISIKLLMPANSCSGSRSCNCLLPFLNQAVVCTCVLRSQHSQVPRPSYFFFSWSSDGEDENVLSQATGSTGCRSCCCSYCQFDRNPPSWPIICDCFLFTTSFLPHIRSSTEVNFSWVILGLK